MSLRFNHTPEQLDAMVGELVSNLNEYQLDISFQRVPFNRSRPTVSVCPKDIMVFLGWEQTGQEYFSAWFLHPEHGKILRQYYFRDSSFSFHLVNEHE